MIIILLEKDWRFQADLVCYVGRGLLMEKTNIVQRHVFVDFA